jgi:hypothetical protein
VVTAENEHSGFWNPIYPLTEKLRKKFLDSRALSRIMKSLLEISRPYIKETLPEPLVPEIPAYFESRRALALPFTPKSAGASPVATQFEI